MKSIKTIGLIATAMWVADIGNAGTFSIGGFTFDEANSAKTAVIVDGPRNLKIQNARFGKYSSSYLNDSSVRSNEFAQFDKSASLGWLLQPARVPRSKADFYAKSVTLSGAEKSERSVLEITWGEYGVRNLPGLDLVIYESDDSTGFAVSVLKSGSSDFTRAKYQFADTHDATHEVNAYAFDLKDFDVADGEFITAIRIQNIFDSPALAGADKVDTVSGQGMLVFASDAGYQQGFPLVRKARATTRTEESAPTSVIYVAALNKLEPLPSAPVPPGMFAIGGFVFNPTNSVKTVVIVEGPANLKDYSSALFNSSRASEVNGTDQLEYLDPGKSIGRLLRPKSSKRPSHLMFPDVDYSPPLPNVHRCAIELTWGGDELRNKPGKDFVVYEVAEWEGFAVAVQKSGSSQWTPYRYQFTNSVERARQVNAVAFDLSNFGLKENEAITAIRIRNLFNSDASTGADKVDNATGEGTVIYPNDPKYKSSFPLLMKPGGKEFPTELLDADIVYVIGLHDVESPSKVAARPARP